jgi:NAD(P)-dependent dehydrogenase (short-subunit alcohol dehydrogenase family)
LKINPVTSENEQRVVNHARKGMLMVWTCLWAGWCLGQEPVKEFVDKHDWVVDDWESASGYRMVVKDAKGRLNGPITQYDSLDRKTMTGAYVAGDREGLFEHYHPNGRVSSRVEYFASFPIGKYESWYESGKPKEAGNYPADTAARRGKWDWDVYRMESFRDSTGMQLVENGSGNWQSVYDNGKLQETRQLVEAEGRRCLLIRDEQLCRDAVQRTVQELGGLNVLVNNAAEQHPKESPEQITAEQLDSTFRTNIFSFFYFVEAAMPHLKAGDSIINTTSVTAYKGSAQLLDYSSTKGAITAFTRSLSQNLAEKGIRVNAVAPGPIWTPLIPSTFPPEKVESFGKDVPLGRRGTGFRSFSSFTRVTPSASCCPA